MILLKKEIFIKKLRHCIQIVDNILKMIPIKFLKILGNDDNYKEAINECGMRNDGQIIGTEFHNTEERHGLGQVSTEADVIFSKKSMLKKKIFQIDLCKIQKTEKLSVSCFSRRKIINKRPT